MTGRRFAGAVLLACVASVAAPQRSRAQVPGMTMNQFNWYLERTDAFCNWYTDPANKGKQMELWNIGYRVPAGYPATGGKQLYWVFKKNEVPALVKHCDALMQLQRRAAGQ